MIKAISITILTLLSFINLSAQNTFVFIGSYNYDKNKDGIYVFELDTLNGNLNKVSAVKNILNPSFLTLSDNGKYIYSCTDTRTPKDGSLSSFEFNSASKNLTFINTQKTGGENPVFVTLDKNEKWLLSANYNDGSISVLPVNKEGYISNASQFIQFKDSSVNLNRQSSAHIHAAVFSPDNQFVFLPDLGADKIRCFQFDPLQLQPLQNAEFPFTKTTSGSGPRHFVFHPNKKFAYCTEELSGTIKTFFYTNGGLKPFQRIAAHHKKDTFQFSSADIHISPDGKFLYASNRGEENNIAIFRVLKNGKLNSVDYQSTFGKTPRNFAIDATGKFLIVANQSSGNIIVFKRNTKTGLLEKTGREIKIENPTCVRIKRY